MLSIISLLLLRGVLSNDLRGTCVEGSDPLGVEQSCYAQCHVYQSGPGWYGACDNYKIRSADVEGPCGDSAANACLSSFNAAWDPQRTNCGNCYLVEMPYSDGVTRSTYIKTMDIAEGDTKFGISAPAWVRLCPFVCSGSGKCAHDEASCPDGVMADSSSYPGPISCSNDRSKISFRRVTCDGTDLASTQPAAPTTQVTSQPLTTSTAGSTSPPATTSSTAASITAVKSTEGTTTTTTTNKREASTTTSEVTSAATSPPATLPSSSATTPARTSTLPTSTALTTSQASSTSTSASSTTDGDSAVDICQASIGSPTNPTWSQECKILCQYYADAFRPNRVTAEALIASVIGAASYCERINDCPCLTPTSLDFCRAHVGYETNPSWDYQCKELCSYYSGDGRGHCPEWAADEGLIACVMRGAPYCQRQESNDVKVRGTAQEAEQFGPRLGDQGVIAYCKTHVGNRKDHMTDLKCKFMCELWGEPGSPCGPRDSGAGLVMCVLAHNSWCQRLNFVI